MTVPPIELKRHHRKLSEKQTGQVVEAVAELIVNFLKCQREAATPPGRRKQS